MASSTIIISNQTCASMLGTVWRCRVFATLISHIFCCYPIIIHCYTNNLMKRKLSVRGFSCTTDARAVTGLALPDQPAFLSQTVCDGSEMELNKCTSQEPTGNCTGAGVTCLKNSSKLLVTWTMSPQCWQWHREVWWWKCICSELYKWPE